MDISNIDTNKPTVDVLFGSRRMYRVPKYQRSFSWDRSNAEKFWEDISRETSDYFMGSIVLNKSGDYFEIIDGQQRITTISLFFFTLFLFYKQNINNDDAISYIYKYLEFGDITEKFYRLKLSRRNESFYNIILKTQTFDELLSIDIGDDNSNENVIDIIKFFREKLEENKKEDINLEKKRLAELLKKVGTKIFFLEIIVNNYKEASRLFEVLNNRGEDLAEADLVRNFLLSEAERQGFGSEVIDTWGDMEKDLSFASLEKFVRYSSLLMSSIDGLYDRIVEHTERQSSKTVIDLLKQLSLSYKKIIDPNSYGEDDNEIKVLNELKNLGVTQSHSVLLAGYYKYSREDALLLIEFITIFTFRYSSICGKNPNKLEKVYAELAFKIYNSGLLLENVKKELSKLNPDDAEFKKDFTSKEFKNNKLPRYILGKIENYISNEEKIVQESNVHLEHIMPKKADKWIEHDSNYTDLYDRYVNNIGNMVLLSKTINTAIKNSLFDEKKIRYDDSIINLITEIKTKSNWKEDEIKWNANRYFESAKEIWKI